MVMEQALLEQEFDARKSAASTVPPLHRSQLIDGILARNPSADPAFLMRFDNDALKHYLDHLGCDEAPRSRENRWVRARNSSVAWWRDNLD
ncbi:MAG: hypothetical protein RL689_2730 [Planctomycetota bacterium]|jgi:hypothetical protein